MTLAADAFRALANARVSCKRFEPNKVIPDHVMNDILATTMVSGCRQSSVFVYGRMQLHM